MKNTTCLVSHFLLALSQQKNLYCLPFAFRSIVRLLCHWLNKMKYRKAMFSQTNTKCSIYWTMMCCTRRPGWKTCNEIHSVPTLQAASISRLGSLITRVVRPFLAVCPPHNAATSRTYSFATSSPFSPKTTWKSSFMEPSNTQQ